MVGVKVEILKICPSRLAENVFLESFLHTSCIPSLPPFFHQVSCICTCLHNQFTPHSQGTENLVSEFLGKVRRKLGILLAFNWSIFCQQKR